MISSLADDAVTRSPTRRERGEAGLLIESYLCFQVPVHLRNCYRLETNLVFFINSFTRLFIVMSNGKLFLALSSVIF